MNSMHATEQLGSMDTCWLTVQQAHAEPAGAALPARHTLLHRYREPVYRYLFGAVRDPDVAEELSQEFALRLMQGNFRRANPERGRFRDYLKSALINLVNKHLRSQQRRLRTSTENALAAALMTPDGSAGASTWDDPLRQEVLARAWSALKRVQSRYYAVLLLRAEEPELSSSDMAERLTAASGAYWTADQVRKVLERSRAKFADLLLDGVACSLQCGKTEDLYIALAELNLLEYCRAALERRA
jgi:RNA polymerase sigma factor (sigma-70 family)